MKMYYCLTEDGAEPMSITKISKEYGLNRESVSKALRKAHRKMRHPYRTKNFIEYADGI